MTKANILVVDDEKEIAELIEIYLNGEGYQVYCAYNAADGLKLLEQFPIHLAILDIMMPGMDGLEMCREIRKTNNIPIIFLSAKTRSEEHTSELQSRFDLVCRLLLEKKKKNIFDSYI